MRVERDMERAREKQTRGLEKVGCRAHKVYLRSCRCGIVCRVALRVGGNIASA